MVIFLLGAFTTVCSIMRMVQIITISKNGNSTMLVLWGVIELNVGVRTPSFIRQGRFLPLLDFRGIGSRANDELGSAYLHPDLNTTVYVF